MPVFEKSKLSLYFPEDVLAEIQEEAARQDRSLSWIVQKAWKIARRDLQQVPGANDPPIPDVAARPARRDLSPAS